MQQRFPSVFLSALRRSARRPVAITFAPASTKRRQVASPKPEVAPVTSAVKVLGSIGHFMKVPAYAKGNSHRHESGHSGLDELDFERAG